MIVTPEPTGPGQESVWCYPRPAIAQACHRRLRIVRRGVTVADTRRGIRTLETSHPPSYYFPPGDVTKALLQPSPRRSWCEWKGEAVYFDLIQDGETIRDVGWSYPEPTLDFSILRGHIAFYAGCFDGCFVDDEPVTPQAGGFYGGWITSHVAGPFKGGPGSGFW